MKGPLIENFYRVFDVVNFFEEDESKAIVDKALRETSESHRIKRSSTGATGYNVNTQRTSENGFDTHGTTAVAVKMYVTSSLFLVQFFFVIMLCIILTLLIISNQYFFVFISLGVV